MKTIYSFLVALFMSNIAQSQYMVSTYAGIGTAGLENGDVSVAQFKQSYGICKDKLGNIFVADNGNNCIRKITPQGIVSTFAGSPTAGYKNGSVDSALFNLPAGVCVDDLGNVYVADLGNQRIRKINTSGIVSTVAGSGIAGFNDGIGLAAQFNYPRGICIDKNYNLYVGDSWNHRIRKIATNGTVTTYAGGGTAIGIQSVGAYIDATNTAARFYTPSGVTVDTTGNLYVADAFNHRIRKIDTSGIVSTVVGSGPTGQGQGGYLDGNALSSRLNVPTEVFVDSLNNLYIGDTFGNRVRKMDNNTGAVSSIGGDGTAGFADGAGNVAKFNSPRGLVAYTNGKVYVVDFNNYRIRLLTPISLGTNEFTNNNSINIYPNPVTTKLTIETTQLTKESVLTIIDINGQELKRLKLEANKTQIDISNLTSGIYFVKLITYNIAEVRMVIKE